MRSEDFIPEDLRRLLRQPYTPYVLGCACLMLAVFACFFGIRKVADSRIVPITAPLTKTDRDTVERVLLQNRLSDYEFSADNRLMVPAGQRDEFLSALSQVDLGHGDPNAAILADLEKSKFWEPREERLRRFQLAQQAAVAESLRAFSGIDDAYVNFDEATSGGLHPTREIKALVSIQPCPGWVMDGKLMTYIRRTVAAHRAGLLESNVTIVNRQTGEAYDGSIMVSNPTQQAREIQRATLQRQWNENVARALSFIPGATVETHVELASAHESFAETPLRPRRITVAVAVPASHYRRIWEQQSDEARTPTAAELNDLESQTRAEVESLVSSLLPTSPGESPPGLHVALFRQGDATDTLHAETGSSPVNWLRRHSNKIVQLFLVVSAVGLVVFAFRDLFHEDVPDDDEEQSPVEKLRVFAAETESDSESRAVSPIDVPRTVPSKEQRGSSYIHADLTDLVREHPQAASAMLKSWVEKAS